MKKGSHELIRPGNASQEQTNWNDDDENFETSNTVLQTSSALNRLPTRRGNVLMDAFIYDPGSTCHMLNNKDRFLTFEGHEGEVFVGDTKLSIQGMGTAWINVQKQDGSTKRWGLREAFYVPNFHTNVVSASRFRKNRYYLHEKEAAIVDADGIAAVLQEKHGLWVIDSLEQQHTTNAI